MFIKFKCFCQYWNNSCTFLLSFLTLLFVPQNAFSESLPESQDKYIPRYHYFSYYVITLEHIPIGVAVASTKNKKTSIPNETFIRVASRVGVSPITSKFYVHTTESATGLLNNNRYSVEEKTISFSDSSTLENKLPSNDSIIFERSKSLSTNLKNLFFESEDEHLLRNTLTPFPKDFFYFQEGFEAKYFGNHLLKYAALRLNSDIKLEIKSVSRREYEKTIKKLSYARIDIGLIASFEDQMDEVDRLLKALSLCQAEMTYLNKSILKKMPYESYLMYRRIINLNKFCGTLEKLILQNETDEVNEVALLTQKQVLRLMKEDSLEIPHVVSEFPEKTLYYNQNMMFLWPRITTLLIQDAIKELQNLYNLDLNRKSLLSIQLRIKSLQPRSVVRADITQIDSFVDFDIKTTSRKPYFLGGTTFANNSDYKLDSICKKHGGRVGIDLTDPKQTIVSSIGIRGVWDNPTKLKTARVFAMQAVSENSCKNIQFKAHPSLVPFLNHELNALKKESLSQDSALLLSNYRSKKLWVMPGKYRMTISSIKNEKVMSIQEFTVGPKTQTNVIANVK